MNAPYLRFIRGDWQNVQFGNYAPNANLQNATVSFALYCPPFYGAGTRVLDFQANADVANNANVSMNINSVTSANFTSCFTGDWYLRALLATGQLVTLDRGNYSTANARPPTVP